MRRRGGPPQNAGGGDGDDSASSDDDVFTKLARKNSKKKKAAAMAKSVEQPSELGISPAVVGASTGSASTATEAALPLTTTSSMKRHHKEMSGTRKRKMDSLLQELEQEKKQITNRRGSDHRDFVPVKKGSFVQAGEEGTTTNIFIGNLSPTLSEEEVTDLFRQFGDLYSVKIMWPRSAEERARDRHTGFVCFMNRQDAEDAMASCDDTDPFNVGRRLTMRWGKNVKKDASVTPIQKRAAAGVPSTSSLAASSSFSQEFMPQQPIFDPAIDGPNAVRVNIPESKERATLISMVASFVAKDGSALERMLEQENNPQYNFLRMPVNPTARQAEEHIYYRWRVYSFVQGDGFFLWRSEPFCMFRPHGCFWIPPPMDPNAAQQERDYKQREEDRMRHQKEERVARRSMVTGRQLERARKGVPNGGARLTQEEMDEFNTLFRQQLSVSRDSICAAMAFCFEKSGAAREIADLLKELLIEEGASIDARCARLYLLSDVLFNSQQPGVRNAFLYRDAIERYSPDIFTSLGKHRKDAIGRFSQNKLATAVSRVLAAWTSWSVYTPMFLDELQDRFEGKEILRKDVFQNEQSLEDAQRTETEAYDSVIPHNDAEHVSTSRKGEWKEIGEEESEQKEAALAKMRGPRDAPQKGTPSKANDVDEEDLEASIEYTDADGEPMDDADVEPIDADGEPIDDADGEPIDADGEPMEDADGEPIEDADGESIDDAGGESIDDADGEPIEDADGEPVDNAGGESSDDADGEPIDRR